MHFEHVCLGQRILCSSETTAPLGTNDVGFQLVRGGARSARIDLLHGDEVVGSCEIAHTSNHLSFLGLYVCADPMSQISGRYKGTFPFSHDAVDMVEIDFLDSQSPKVLASIMLATE